MDSNIESVLQRVLAEYSTLCCTGRGGRDMYQTRLDVTFLQVNLHQAKYIVVADFL